MKKYNKYGANHMNQNNSSIPKWFDANVYQSGDVVSNPFTGKSCELNAEELSMYDYIKGLEYYLSSIDWKDQKRAQTFSKALDWFMTKNPSAYYTLLN